MLESEFAYVVAAGGGDPRFSAADYSTNFCNLVLLVMESFCHQIRHFQSAVTCSINA